MRHSIDRHGDERKKKKNKDDERVHQRNVHRYEPCVCTIPSVSENSFIRESKCARQLCVSAMT